MANSLKLDVRYTHSFLMGVYAANLIFLQVFIKSQAKNNGKELLYKIPPQCKVPFQKWSKKDILSTSFSSYIQEAEHKGKASFGVQGKMSWYVLNVTIQLTSQSFPMKIWHSRKLDNLVYASRYIYVFTSPHFCSPLEYSTPELPNPYPTYCPVGKSTQQPFFGLYIS